MVMAQVGPRGGRGLPPREGRERGDVARRRIVEVALELIADHGFAATTTREIAERLGFTKAALYYHFRSKEDLLAAMVAPAVDDLTALVATAATPSTPADRRRLLEGYVDVVSAHRDLVRVLAQDPSIRGRPAMTAAMALYQRLQQTLSADPGPDVAQQVRVRAALGAVHAALLGARDDDDPAVVHRAAVAAACGALGIAGPPAG